MIIQFYGTLSSCPRGLLTTPFVQVVSVLYYNVKRWKKIFITILTWLSKTKINSSGIIGSPAYFDIKILMNNKLNKKRKI